MQVTCFALDLSPGAKDPLEGRHPQKAKCVLVCGVVQFFGWQGLEEERDGKEIST